jgi:predicted aminopeptidase
MRKPTTPEPGDLNGARRLTTLLPIVPNRQGIRRARAPITLSDYSWSAASRDIRLHGRAAVGFFVQPGAYQVDLHARQGAAVAPHGSWTFDSSISGCLPQDGQ